MRIESFPAAHLSGDLIDRWIVLQQSNPALDNPFFRPEMTQAIAAVRDDVEVAVLEDGGVVQGFFPFQRQGRVGRPVGGPMSDFQGVITGPEQALDPVALLRGCGLSRWDFDHLLACQTAFAPFHQRSRMGEGSPYIDLAEGFDAYEASRRAAGSKELVKLARKRRKVQREHGELRFELRAAEPGVFQQLVDWKSEQYRRSQLPVIFEFGWPTELLERILATKGEAFEGLLSSLHVGDRLVAVHLGVRSHGVLHSWFPAFDRDYYKYSPGLMLLIEISRSVAEQGIERFDLGKGDAEYKRNCSSGEIPLAEGSVDTSALRRAVRGAVGEARVRVRDSRLGDALQAPWRRVRPLLDGLRFK